MSIILLLWWSLGHGNPVVPSRWQATSLSRSGPSCEERLMETVPRHWS
jgi:hypothetical protein